MRSDVVEDDICIYHFNEVVDKNWGIGIQYKRFQHKVNYDTCCKCEPKEESIIVETSNHTFLVDNKILLINKNYTLPKTNFEIDIAHVLDFNFVNLMLCFKFYNIKLPRRLIISCILTAL